MQTELNIEAAQKRHYADVKARLAGSSKNQLSAPEIVPEPEPVPERQALVRTLTEAQIADLIKENDRILADKYKKRADNDIVNSPRIADIIRASAKFYGFTLPEMLSVRKNQKLVRARHVAMYLCRKLTSHSLPHIGRRFGGRDHTTVMYGLAKISALIADGDLALIGDLAQIEQAAMDLGNAS
jgi:chromosomal replication initiation ATPase DnaA